MSFLIMIGTHSWGRLFPPSVHSGGIRGRNLLASWGSWGYWGYPASPASQRSQGSRASPASPADLASRAFHVSQASRVSWQSRGSWGCGGSWASWASWSLILGVWLLFSVFDPKEIQKQKNRGSFSCAWLFGSLFSLEACIYKFNNLKYYLNYSE